MLWGKDPCCRTFGVDGIWKDDVMPAALIVFNRPLDGAAISNDSASQKPLMKIFLLLSMGLTALSMSFVMDCEA